MTVFRGHTEGNTFARKTEARDLRRATAARTFPLAQAQGSKKLMKQLLPSATRLDRAAHTVFAEQLKLETKLVLEKQFDL